MRVTIYADDAGAELSEGSIWTSPYPVTVGIVANISPSNGRPLWSEAAMLYRNWALKEAPWTKASLAERNELPSWYRSNSMWLNTHWQCHDVFNVTGGEPAVVTNMVSQVAKLFNIPSIALHWYEWQQGPNPAPSQRYKFDTHYPDYFPPRQPQLFSTVMEELREDLNVYTVPYINGRIFDVDSDTYIADNGAQYCSKYVVNPRLRSSSEAENGANLAPYVETYGSDATFCVASPYTTYWQQTLSNTTAELTDKWRVDGVYIDQIGAAQPKLCYDPIHGHTLGGGTYWKDGYEEMLKSIKSVMSPRSDGYLPPIFTENNAEVYMDQLQGYLTLTAMKMSLAQSPAVNISEYRRLSPAFPAVYGGYYIGFGAEWFKTDFSDSDWFCGKLSAMLMTGTQLGWFSLISIIDDPNDSCGDMGVGESLLDPDNADIVQFLQLLSIERTKVVSYLVDGHLARPVVLSPPSPISTQTVPSKGKPYLQYDQVSTSAWQLNSNDSSVKTLIMLAGNTLSFTYSGEIIIDFSNWGYADQERLQLNVISDSAGGSVAPCTIRGPTASVSVNIMPRSIVFVELKSTV